MSEKTTDESAVRRRRMARRIATASLGGTIGFAGVASAQGASAASGVACGTGLGDLLRLGLGILVLMFAMLALVRLMMGVNNKGSTRSDKKQEGNEQIKGAGFTAAAVFIPAIAAGAFSYAGIPFFSCVNLNKILGTIVVTLI